MKQTIKVINLLMLMLALSTWAKAQCSAGSFTLNTPSSSNIFSTSVNLTWTESSGSLGYQVEFRVGTSGSWSDGGSTSAGVTSKTVTGLTAGTSHQFRVIASGIESAPGGPGGEPDVLPCTVNSNTRTVTTEPAAPSTRTASNIQTNSFTARWNSSTGATSYDLDVSISSSFTTFVSGYNGLNVTTTTQSVSGLNSATRYYYRVRAVNSSGESSNSLSRTVYTIPDAPTIHEASGESQTSFVASWDAVDRADSYRLDVSTSSFFSSYVSGYENLFVSGTSQTVSGLTEGSTYFFRVRAYDNAGFTTSANSTTKNTTTIPLNPVATNASGFSQTSFTANWEAVDAATNYRLDVSTVSNFSTFVPGFQDLNVSTTSAEVDNLTEGTTYFYRVRSENASGVSSNSNEIETTTVPGDPTPLAATAMTQTSFIANWEAETAATSYELDVAFDDAFTEYIIGFPKFGITTTEESVTGLIAGRSYYYRLRAVNASGKSGNSTTIVAITIPADPEIASASTITASSFVANWGSVQGASNYRLDVSLANDFSTFVDGYENLLVNGTSQTVTGLQSAQAYHYRVRSENSSGTSGNSGTTNDYTLPEIPVLGAATSISQSSFTVNWSTVDRAESYRLDVSESASFNTLLTGYSDLEVNGTSHDVIGLNAGVNYYVRLRSFDSGDNNASDHSETQTVLTIPANPVMSGPTELTEISAKANWAASQGADHYLLDVSTTNDFSEFLDGYNGLQVSSTFETINGLNGGQTYFYRVKAANGSGISGYSINGEILTVPSAPVIASPSAIDENNFIAHWQNVTGVENYLLDVSTSSGFETFVEGYEDLIIDGTLLSAQVSDLKPGTHYFYRVSAQNSSGNSAHSEAVGTITVPELTAIQSFTNHTSSKFQVTWAAVTGTDTYEVFVATDPSFDTPLENYNPKAVQNILTETFIENLEENTIYYVKVRCTNASGASKDSQIKITSTTKSDGTVSNPSIDNLTFDENNSKITWSTSGGTGGMAIVLFRHRQIKEKEFNVINLDVNEDGNYEVPVESDWIDDLGMQYDVGIEDLTGRVETSSLITYHRTVEEVKVPTAKTFGIEVRNYQMISVPYELAVTRIQDLFESVLGSYDKAKWRLLKYKDAETGYIDYEEGLSVANLERGAAYWFISSESIDLTFGDAQVPSNTLDEPFQLELVRGWNQIGNPYLEDLSWSSILAVNGNPETVGELLLYNASDEAFESGDLLPVFGGGFVFADQAITLDIPVDINASESEGRFRSDAKSRASSSDWIVDFTLSQGHKTSRLSGIGMSTTALSGKDQKDVINPPHLANYVSAYTLHEEFVYEEFVKDVVNTKDLHHWRFELQSNTDDPIHLAWDQLQVPEGSLILYDLEANRLIDMQQNDTYLFGKGNQSFVIYYSTVDWDIHEIAPLGQGYPNPVIDQMLIPYSFHLGPQSSEATLTIHDINGMSVHTQTESSADQGVRNLEWNQDDRQLPAGLYFYRIESVTAGFPQRTTGKIIIK